MESNQLVSITQFKEDQQAIVAEYKCSICNGIYFEPIADTCGHVFCKRCFLDIIKTDLICPETKDLITADIHPIPFISNILNKYDITCKYNCDWIGRINNYGTHIGEDCPNAIVNCKYPTCIVTKCRSEIDSHQLECNHIPYICQYCYETLPSIYRQEHEANICPKIAVRCECGFDVIRCDMDLHIRDLCINTRVLCEYNSIGCDAMVSRKDMESHLSQSHERFLVKSVLAINDTLERFEKLISSLEANLYKDGGIYSDEGQQQVLKKKRGRKPKNQKNINDFLDEEYNFASEPECNGMELNDNGDIIDDKCLKGVRVTKRNTVKCDKQGSLLHSFALTTLDLTKSSHRWYVKINSVGRWLGLGVCSKNEIMRHNYKFGASSNGCFVLSTNGYIWNPNSESENNMKLKEMPVIENGNIIQFYYDVKKQRLEIRFKDYTTILTKVYSTDGPLVPCAIFLGYNDEVTFFKFENI